MAAMTMSSVLGSRAALIKPFSAKPSQRRFIVRAEDPMRTPTHPLLREMSSHVSSRLPLAPIAVSGSRGNALTAAPLASGCGCRAIPAFAWASAAKAYASGCS